MNNSADQFFSLQVTKADGSSMTYRFTQEATVGCDPRNDVILIGPHVSAKLLHFKQQNNYLSLTFLGTNETADLNRTLLQKNKMYIIEKEDSIQIGLIKIVIL
jgi:hypothetical protein